MISLEKLEFMKIEEVAMATDWCCSGEERLWRLVGIGEFLFFLGVGKINLVQRMYGIKIETR